MPDNIESLGSRGRRLHLSPVMLENDFQHFPHGRVVINYQDLNPFKKDSRLGQKHIGFYDRVAAHCRFLPMTCFLFM
jgi:hypothetical protein